MPDTLDGQAGPRPMLSFKAGWGTGFFVSNAGDIMTAGHVVEACRVVRVAGDGFEGRTAKIIAIDGEDDLALLRVAERPKASLHIAEGQWGDSEKAIQAVVRKQDFGQGITIGYPGNSVSVVSQKVLLPPALETPDQQHFYRVMDGLIERGDSGSPVLY